MNKMTRYVTRLWLFASLFVTAQMVPMQALADERRLTATEIIELLQGNTAIGHWIDHSYRQYFAEDGSTIYQQEGTRSTLGAWRVNETTDHYESWWKRDGWGGGYSIVIKDGVYYWVNERLKITPQAFEVVSGQQLTP